MEYVLFLFLSIVISLGLVPGVLWLTRKLQVLDIPNSDRKLHGRVVPLLGGLAIFFASVLVSMVFYFVIPKLSHVFPLNFWLGMLAGGVVISLGGYFDDRYSLPAYASLWAPVIAAAFVVYSGIGVGLESITLPFLGTLSLTYSVLGISLSYVFVLLWLLGMMFTTKFLDGVDGLTSGIGALASVMMFFVSLTSKVDQPATAMLALILAGSILGFWFYNKPPAKIFLGEGGSLYIGYALGVLSVLLGAKIATALLVMGVPILDTGVVIFLRVLNKQSPFKGDRRHLHFKLQDFGLSHVKVLVVYYSIAFVFGASALIFQTRGKGIALILLVLGFLAFYTLLSRHQASGKK